MSVSVWVTWNQGPWTPSHPLAGRTQARIATRSPTPSERFLSASDSLTLERSPNVGNEWTGHRSSLRVYLSCWSVRASPICGAGQLTQLCPGLVPHPQSIEIEAKHPARIEILKGMKFEEMEKKLDECLPSLAVDYPQFQSSIHFSFLHRMKRLQP